MALQKTSDKTVAKFVEPIVPAPKKTPKKVLDEDEYTQGIEKIIQRDFFPSLEKLKAQNDYLEAQQRNDVAKMRELQIKYGQKFKRKGTGVAGKETPATFETPLAGQEKRDEVPGALPTLPDQENEVTDASSSSSSKPTKDKSDLSLDTYLNKYTSEDNASFDDIMMDSMAKHRVKHAWMYEAEVTHKEKCERQLALPDIEKQALTYENKQTPDTWTYKAYNPVMYVPEDAPKTDAEIIEEAKMKPQKVVHENTRLSTNVFDTDVGRGVMAQAATVQAAQLTGKIGVDGKELLPNETPKVRGYGFVSTPTPVPGRDETPLMTWGEIEGTPFRLDGGDTPLPNVSGPQFRIPDVPQRDIIALSLSEKASAQHRKKKEEALRRASANLASPSPKTGSTSERLGSMSLAAQRLASTKLGLRLGTGGRTLTPSPSPRRTPKQSSSHRKTSELVASYRSTPSSSSRRDTARSLSSNPESLTDNLLFLPTPKRRRSDQEK